MGRGLAVVWRDVSLLTLAGFLLIVVLVLPFVNIPGEDEEATPPGNVSVEISWDAESDGDVDLWVKAPGDQAVGYSQKSGKIFNLLRDDLGVSNDILGVNYEHAYSRGIPSGEYIVNLHWFREGTTHDYQTVNVVVKLHGPNGKRTIGKTTVKLDTVREEVTAFRFVLDEDSNLVDGSVHSDFIPIRQQVSKDWDRF